VLPLLRAGTLALTLALTALCYHLIYARCSLPSYISFTCTPCIFCCRLHGIDSLCESLRLRCVQFLRHRDGGVAHINANVLACTLLSQGVCLLAQTGLAEKAKAMGVSLPSGAAGSTPADQAAEKAAVAAAAPGIVKVWG